MHIDLSRYGVPKIDQHKVPIPAKAQATSGPHEENLTKTGTAKTDSLAASKRLLSKPPPSKLPRISKAIRDSIAAARRDSIAAARRTPARPAPKVPPPH